MSIKVNCVGRDTPYFVLPVNTGLGYQDDDWKFEKANLVFFDCSDTTREQRDALSDIIPKLRQALPKSSLKTGKGKSLTGDRTCIHQKVSFGGTLFPSNWKIVPKVTLREYTPTDILYREGTCLASGFFGGVTLYTILVPLMDLDGKETGKYYTLADNVVDVICYDRYHPGSVSLDFQIQQGAVEDWDDDGNPITKISHSKGNFLVSWTALTFELEVSFSIPVYDGGFRNGVYCHTIVMEYPTLYRAAGLSALKAAVGNGRGIPRFRFNAEFTECPGIIQDEDTGEVAAKPLTEMSSPPIHIPAFDSLSIEGKYTNLVTYKSEGGFSGQDVRYVDFLYEIHNIGFPTLDSVSRWKFDRVIDPPDGSYTIWGGPLAVSLSARIEGPTLPASDVWNYDIKPAALQRVFRIPNRLDDLGGRYVS